MATQSPPIVTRTNLDDFLPIRDLYVNGTLQKFAANLNFIGANFSTTLTQNSDGTYTLNILLSGPGQNATVYIVDDEDFTVEDLDGDIIVVFTSISARRAINVPRAGAAIGMRITAICDDSSYTDVNCIRWTPASGQIRRAGVQSSTYDQTPDNAGFGGLTFFNDGTLWRASS
jgi:hypothetical protein